MQYCNYQKPKYTKRFSRPSRWDTNAKHPVNFTTSLPWWKKVTVEVPRNRPEGPEGGRGIALLFLDLGARRGWVVSTTPRPLYPRKKPGTHCLDAWRQIKIDCCISNHISHTNTTTYHAFTNCLPLHLFQINICVPWWRSKLRTFIITDQPLRVR
jgi:hypothetical protein